MRQCSSWMRVFTKRIWKRPFIYIAGALILALALFMKHSTSMDMRVMRIGLLPGSEELAGQVAETLIAENGELEFYLAASEEELRREVATGKTECGYIFSDHMGERLEKKDFADLITTVKAPSGIMDRTINEIVFSALIQNYGGEIAANQVKESGLFPGYSQADLERVRSSYKDILYGGKTFTIEYQEYYSQVKGYQLPSRQSVLVFRGVGTMMVFLFSMAGGLAWYRQKEKGLFQLLPRGRDWISRAGIVVPYVYSAGVLVLLGNSLALPRWRIADLWKECWTMTLLTVLLSLWVILLTYVIHRSLLWLSALPILTLGGLFFTPVLINLAPVLPAARYVGWLYPMTYYFRCFPS